MKDEPLRRRREPRLAALVGAQLDRLRGLAQVVGQDRRAGRAAPPPRRPGRGQLQRARRGARPRGWFAQRFSFPMRPYDQVKYPAAVNKMAAMDSPAAAGPAWLVLPTYNEAANIAAIVEAARAQPSRRRPHPRRRRQLAGRHRADRRRARRRRSGDRGPAPRRQGRPRPRLHRRLPPRLGRRCRVRPADGLRFLPRPADLPRLLAAADGADLAIGSRYVAGGGVTDWSLAAARDQPRRQPLREPRPRLCVQRDLTGGFKCFRREVLETIDLDAVVAKGYVFQVEMTYRAIRAGFDRPRGADRLPRPPGRRLEDVRARSPLEATWQVPLLRLRGVR